MLRLPTILATSILALTLSAQARAGERPALELRWGDKSVSPVEMQTDDTAIALDEVFDPFADVGPERKVYGLCYAGDVNQVCSLLAKMAKVSAKKHAGGDHGLAALKGCRIAGRGQAVEAKIELSNDYDQSSQAFTAIVQACAN